MGARKKAAASRGGNKIGVIYARFSSHSQREESIEQQVERCRAYAEANGLNVSGGVYPDKAVSGRTDKRPHFQEMMRDAEAGKFDYVIAWKSSRMGRNMLEAMVNEAKLRSMGIRCYYTEEDFSDDAAGRFAQRSMMNVNQFYSESMSEDIRRGMEYNATQAKVNGPIPWGYKRGPDGKYAIDPEKAPIVREIFKRVSQGEIFMDIARDLNNRGIRTRSGEWNKGSFHRMLKNEAYIGVYQYNGHRIEGGVPPIIDKEVWDEVQEIVSQPAKRGAGTSGDYLLTGLLYCGDCRGPMVGISGTSRRKKLYHYYSCNNQRLRKECERKPVPRDWLEDIVVKTVYEAMSDDLIQWMVDATVNYIEKIQEERGLPRKKELLAEEKRKVKNINDAIAEGIWNSSTSATLLEHENTIAILEKDIARLEREYQPPDREHVEFYFNMLRSRQASDRRDQRTILEQFVKAVYVYDDHVDIILYYPHDGGKRTKKFYTIPDGDVFAQNPQRATKRKRASNGCPFSFDTMMGIRTGAGVNERPVDVQSLPTGFARPHAKGSTGAFFWRSVP